MPGAVRVATIAVRIVQVVAVMICLNIIVRPMTDWFSAVPAVMLAREMRMHPSMCERQSRR